MPPPNSFSNFSFDGVYSVSLYGDCNVFSYEKNNVNSSVWVPIYNNPNGSPAADFARYWDIFYMDFQYTLDPNVFNVSESCPPNSQSPEDSILTLASYYFPSVEVPLPFSIYEYLWE